MDAKKERFSCAFETGKILRSPFTEPAVCRTSKHLNIPFHPFLDSCETWAYNHAFVIVAVG
jgi:hypothetical protein